MTTHLEHLLEECLEARLEDSEAILRSYPQEAEQLHPLLEAASLARRYYGAAPEPPPNKLADGRARLLAEAARYRKQVAAATIRPGEARMIRSPFLLRFAAALLAATIILVSTGAGIAWAAQDSLPGDALYPAKLAVEDLRLSLAPDPATGVGLSLQFAAERAQELQAMIQNGQPIPESMVTRMQNLFQHALQRASMAPPEEIPGLLEQVAQRTQTQAQFMEQLQATAPEDAQMRLTQAHRMCLQVHENTQTMMGGHSPSSTPTPSMGTPEATPGGPRATSPAEDPTQQRDREQDKDRDREQDGSEGESPDREQDKEQDREQDKEQDRERDQLEKPDVTPSHDPMPLATPGPHGGESGGQGGQGSGKP
jgi:hypothetical protein